jgi:hypothetical protein
MQQGGLWMRRCLRSLLPMTCSLVVLLTLVAGQLACLDHVGVEGDGAHSLLCPDVIHSPLAGDIPLPARSLSLVSPATTRGDHSVMGPDVLADQSSGEQQHLSSYGLRDRLPVLRL